MKRARGIDISKYQIAFEDPGNLDFIIVKATEGWDVDPCYQDYLPNIRSIPIRGAYHYFRTETNAIAQAENFLLQSLKGDFHFLAVDYEAHNNTLDHQGALDLLKCLQYLEANQDLPVFLYTSPYIYRDNVRIWREEFDHYPLWLARWKYSDSEVADPTTNLAGDDLERSWSIWQHTSTGEGKLFGVRSVSVDLNVFNGTRQEMIDLLGDDEMKQWYESKTIWVGIMEIGIALGGLVATFLDAGDYTYPALVLLFVGILKVLLRFVTEQPIE